MVPRCSGNLIFNIAPRDAREFPGVQLQFVSRNAVSILTARSVFAVSEREGAKKAAPRLAQHSSDSGVANYAVRLDALGADVEVLGRAVNHGAYPLDIRVKTTLGAAVRVRDTHSETRTFTTYIAYCSHSHTPVRSFTTSQ